jgi:hypothetical protein
VGSRKGLHRISLPPLRIHEVDGSPDLTPVFSLRVTNSSLTDLGGGSADLNTSGGGNNSVVTKITTYTITTADRTILANASGGAFVITLPTAVGNTGLVFTVKKIDATANVVTLDGAGAETIDGAANYALTVQYESVDVVSDGVGWNIV